MNVQETIILTYRHASTGMNSRNVRSDTGAVQYTLQDQVSNWFLLYTHGYKSECNNYYYGMQQIFINSRDLNGFSFVGFDDDLPFVVDNSKSSLFLSSCPYSNKIQGQWGQARVVHTKYAADLHRFQERSSWKIMRHAIMSNYRKCFYTQTEKRTAQLGRFFLPPVQKQQQPTSSSNLWMRTIAQSGMLFCITKATPEGHILVQ